MALRHVVVACLLAFASTGCSGQDAASAAQQSAQPMPDFILQSDAEPAVIGTGEEVCLRAKGTWDAGKTHCAMTEAMCVESTDAKWTDGICIAAVTDASQCTGFSGMRWSGERCEVSHITEEELVRFGF